jgi:hypothetical protein
VIETLAVVGWAVFVVAVLATLGLIVLTRFGPATSLAARVLIWVAAAGALVGILFGVLAGQY